MTCVKEFSNTHTIFEGTSEIQQLVIARAIPGSTFPGNPDDVVPSLWVGDEGESHHPM
jgi:hypothetical protein